MKQFIIYYIGEFEYNAEYWIQAEDKDKALEEFYKVVEDDELDCPFVEFVSIEETTKTFEERLLEFNN